jgi:hypothetical protein
MVQLLFGARVEQVASDHAVEKPYDYESPELHFDRYDGWHQPQPY